MTSIHLVCRPNGVLKSCRAEGHSGYGKKGTDIVCSAISILVRTALQTLEDLEGVCIESDLTTRGIVDFCVKQTEFSETINAELAFAQKFLENGFSSLVSEYPENVILYKQIEA
ncbi:MAG: ribosomal-processing cysteine protease Prp [Treponema sp.]|nr:ribosomal-processing cysteine protease Prp [Treponema sp.]